MTMLLQTGMYNACETLCHNKDKTPAIDTLQDLELLKDMTRKWKRFFKPYIMMADMGVVGSLAQSGSLDYLYEMSDLLDQLESSSSEILRCAQYRNTRGLNRRIDILYYLIDTHVLPTFKKVGYRNLSNAKVLRFKVNASFMSSVVPLETTVDPYTIPGAYSWQEKDIIEVYLKAMLRAPSVQRFMVSDLSDTVWYEWVSFNEFGGPGVSLNGSTKRFIPNVVELENLGKVSGGV